MSTKVYNAYRVKEGVALWPLLWNIKTIGIQNVREVLIKLYNKLLSNEQTKEEARKNLKLPDDIEIGPYEVALSVHEAVRRHLGNPHRNDFDFNVSVAVREHQGRFYLKAYCDMNMAHVLDFLSSAVMSDRIEDFHYQNSTDRPSKISEEEWKHRSVTWAGMAHPKDWQNFVLLTICDYEALPFIDPAMDWGDDNPWRPLLKEIADRRWVRESESKKAEPPKEAI